MSFKKLLKPTKTKLLSFLGLFLFLGFIKIFTLEDFITHKIYKMSLFGQYNFQLEHYKDSWYLKGDGTFWLVCLFLHIITAYILVCVSAFIVNRLRGRD
jgi:hypothetical protein